MWTRLEVGKQRGGTACGLRCKGDGRREALDYLRVRRCRAVVDVGSRPLGLSEMSDLGADPRKVDALTEDWYIAPGAVVLHPLCPLALGHAIAVLAAAQGSMGARQ
jgi:hypothetical protein